MKAAAESVRAEYYRRAASDALNGAKAFRDLWRRTGAEIDRIIMRSFARQWRHYTARSRASS